MANTNEQGQPGLGINCYRRLERNLAEMNVTKSTDYLVLGTFASRDWINTAYGRKIEKAIEYRAKHGRTEIISEDHWASGL